MAAIIHNRPSRSLEFLASIKGSLEEYLGIDNNQRLSTPKYMIKMDSLLSSEISDYTDHTQLYYFDFDISRTTSGNIADKQVSSGRVEMSNPVFVISNSAHTPDLIQRLINGGRVDEIKITRYQNIEDKNQPAEVITFKECYYQGYVLKFDYLVGDFRFTQYSHDTTSTLQDGVKEGNATANYNLKTGASDVSAGA